MSQKPGSYALMIRPVRPGVSAMCRIPEHKMGAFLEAGWKVLISDAQVRTADIEDTYRADLKERR